MALELEMIKMKIAELGASLNQSIPGFAGILQQIHKEMAAQPELSYKLADEEIATVIRGLEKLHDVHVTQPKNAKALKKGISKVQGSLLSEDDV
jgi:hypothetical protein